MTTPRLKLFLPFLLVGTIVLFINNPISNAEESLKTSNPNLDIFHIAKPSISHFTSTDGLPVNAVMTLERDERGFVWFGTQDGAAVFNGYNFSVVNMPNRAVSNYIYDILTAKDGSIWFATGAGGVHRLKDSEWQTFDTKSGLATNETRALFESFSSDGKQTIWIGRRDGLSKLTDGVVENYNEEDGLPDKRVRCILETTDEQGNKTLWVGTYGGLAVWNENEKKVYDEKDGLPGKIIFSLMQTTNSEGKNEIWAGTDKGLAKFANNEWTTFEDVSDILSKTIRSLGKTAKNDGTQTIWIGTDGNGLGYLENNNWFFLDEKDGLPNDLIFGFTPTGSSDGSVWISHLGKGVSRFERSNWRKIDSSNGLNNEIVFSLGETISDSGESTTWIGTFGGGLISFINGEKKIFNETNGLQNNFVQTILATKNDVGETLLYVGTEKGVLKYENQTWQEIDLKQEKDLLEIWDIKASIDQNGRKGLLISASVGLIRKYGDDVETFDTTNGLPDSRVRNALETVSKDGKKTLWAATYNGGLAKYENDKWSVIDDSKGLLTNKIYTVSEIKYNNKRELWIGTGGGGIAILDLDDEKQELEIINTENSKLLPSDSVYKIFQDSQNRIYATSSKGVSRITPLENGNIQDFGAYFFTTEDGLPNNECTAGAGFVDSKGRIWVGTVGGAAVLDVSKEFKDDVAEPLFLQNVLIGGEKHKLLPNAELAYSENNMVFEYVMPTNFRESATLYRTQMVGLEDKPTEWTKEPRREFTFIPSGDFIFKVWGKDASGNISEPLELAFSVRPPWWFTWWAIILYFLATIAIVSLIAFLIYRNRYRRMLEIERVRTRIATDLHDDVGSSLSKISILSEVLAHSNNEIEIEEKASLLTIADTSREVVSSMSDMVWSINPNRDNLKDTIQRIRQFASEVLSAKDIQFTIDAPKDDKEIKLDVDLRRQLYLVFKESINNAVKHSNCTKVEIELKRKTDGLFLRVSDNGNGFEINGSNYGNGLGNMKKRAEEIGGNFEINSEIGKGTVITLQLPRRLAGFNFPKAT